MNWSPRYASLIDKLASLEHDQWMKWSKTLIDNEPSISDTRRQRWESLWVPFASLSENDKNRDREWAEKVIEILRLDVQENGPL